MANIKKILIGIGIFGGLILASQAHAITPFLSVQVGTGAASGTFLETNGVTSTWAAVSGGSGTVGPATSTYVAVFNASGTITGYANLTYVSSTQTLSAGFFAAPAGENTYIGNTADTSQVEINQNGIISFQPSNSSGTILIDPNTGDSASLDTSLLSGNQNFQFPNASGILCLTSTCVTSFNGATGTITYGTTVQMPTPAQLAAGATCGGVYPVYDYGACHNDVYNAATSSLEIDSGNYTYDYSVPIINASSGIYVLDKGAQTTWSFTPTYLNILSVQSTSTQVINFSTSTPATLFVGEALTAVGASLPSGLAINKLYYIQKLTSSTVVLTTNAGLTTTSTISSLSGTGVLETPAATYDIGQSKAFGWGANGISLTGPNNGSSTGWYFGGTQGAARATLSNGNVKNFYHNIYTGDNTFFFTIQQYNSNFNAPNYAGGGLLWNDSTANSDEEMGLVNDVFADAEPNSSSTATNAGVELTTSGFDDWECSGTAFDDTGVYLNWYDGQNNSFHAVNCRWENPGSQSGGWVGYVPISTNYGNPNNSVDIGLTNAQFLNDGSGSNAFPEMMSVGSNVVVTLNDVSVAANTYISASTVTDFMTLGSNSTVSSLGFANQSSYPGFGTTGPGVTYLYGTRVPVAGVMTNAPSFLDSTLKVTGNLFTYNGFYTNPQVWTASTTLFNYSPDYQVCDATSSITLTLPAIANNTGYQVWFKNRGTTSCIVSTVSSTDYMNLSGNNATATTFTVNAGSSTIFTDDATYWDQN